MENPTPENRQIPSAIEAAACLDALGREVKQVLPVYRATNAGYLGLVLNGQPVAPPLMIGTMDPDWVSRYRGAAMSTSIRWPSSGGSRSTRSIGTASNASRQTPGAT